MPPSRDIRCSLPRARTDEKHYAPSPDLHRYPRSSASRVDRASHGVSEYQTNGSVLIGRIHRHRTRTAAQQPTRHMNAMVILIVENFCRRPLQSGKPNELSSISQRKSGAQLGRFASSGRTPMRFTNCFSICVALGHAAAKPNRIGALGVFASVTSSAGSALVASHHSSTRAGRIREQSCASRGRPPRGARILPGSLSDPIRA